MQVSVLGWPAPLGQVAQADGDQRRDGMSSDFETWEDCIALDLTHKGALSASLKGEQNWHVVWHVISSMTTPQALQFRGLGSEDGAKTCHALT